MSNIRQTVSKFFSNAVPEAEELLGRKMSPTGSHDVSRAWREANPQTPEEYTQFYRTVNYIDELTYLSAKSKIRSSIIGFESLDRYVPGIETILDYGAGIGSECLAGTLLGYKMFYYDINEPNMELFRLRQEKHGMTIPILSDWRSELHYDCIMTMDVIAHMPDPVKFIVELSELTDCLLFTVDLGVHDEDKGGYSQHSDVPRSHVWKALRDVGYEKIKLQGVALPPQLWKRK